jgi:hypothetical protein
MSNERNEELQQAYATLVKEIDRSTKEGLRDALKGRTLPEGSHAKEGVESAGALYKAKLVYDGGDFTADVNVEVYDSRGNRVCRLTAWGNTMGKGTYTSHGTVNLNYQPREIKDWRFTYIAESNVGGFFIRWTGMLIEAIGNGIFEPIPAKGLSVGSGYVQVP